MLKKNESVIYTRGGYSNSIELWRYLFAVGVAIMHFGYYNGFYIAVDFFFILSGFLLHKSLQKRDYAEPLRVLRSRIARLYPEYLLAFVILFVLDLKIGAFAGITLRELFTRSFFELFMLQISGPYVIAVNGITWYISAMIICFPLIIFGLCYVRRFYLWVVCPYSALGIYSFFASNWGHVDFGFVWLGSINGGLLRAFAALNMGVLAYALYCQIPFERLSAKAHHGLAVIEAGIFLFVMIWSAFAANRQTNVDLVEVLLLMAGVIIAFGEKGFLARLTDKKAVRFLGSISYAIYLCQGLGNYLVATLAISQTGLRLAVLVVVQTAIGAAVHGTVTWVSRRLTLRAG